MIAPITSTGMAELTKKAFGTTPGTGEALNEAVDRYNEAIPSRSGATSEEDRQSEQDNPGQQTQGNAESETSPPESAGD